MRGRARRRWRAGLGDLLQGTPVNSFRAWRARGAASAPETPEVPEAHPVIAAMNAAGNDAAAIGNHEFNYGIPFLRDVLAGARFPFLSANIRVAGTDSAAFSERG